MNQEEYIEELRWRLEVLKTQLWEGIVHIAEHLADDLEQSLMAVKYGQDGRIDLATVDGCIRAMAMAAATLQSRRQENDAAPLFSQKKQ